MASCCNILSQLARDKLVCCEASSEESLPAKVCTKEHELYAEALQIGKRAHQRKAFRQQVCKVDTMGIEWKNMRLSRLQAGSSLKLRVSYEEKSAEVIVVYGNEPRRGAGRTHR